MQANVSTIASDKRAQKRIKINERGLQESVLVVAKDLNEQKNKDELGVAECAIQEIEEYNQGFSCLFVAQAVTKNLSKDVVLMAYIAFDSESDENFNDRSKKGRTELGTIVGKTSNTVFR